MKKANYTSSEEDSIKEAYEKVLKDNPEYITAKELKDAVKPFLKQGENTTPQSVGVKNIVRGKINMPISIIPNMLGGLIKGGEIKPSEVNNQTLQVTRQPRVTVIKDNSKVINGNYIATKYYNDIVNFLREQNCSVLTDRGISQHKPTTSDLIINHNRNIDRLRLLDKNTKVINLPSFTQSCFFNKEMKKAILNKLKND